MHSFRSRILLAIGCILGLLLVFIFQGTDLSSVFGIPQRSIAGFMINRSVRFLLNDGLMIGLIYAIFNERKFVIFALFIELAGLLIFLVPYFVIKAQFPSYNGPLISFLHRLVLNPILQILLIPAFYLQKRFPDK